MNLPNNLLCILQQLNVKEMKPLTVADGYKGWLNKRLVIRNNVFPAS